MPLHNKRKNESHPVWIIMTSTAEHNCRRCNRELIEWKVVNSDGQLIGFMTCPIYCDRRCHMCGGTLQIKTAKNLLRTVKCKKCFWEDSCNTDPSVRQKNRSSTRSASKPKTTSSKAAYQRLTAEELRRQLGAHRFISRKTVCNSCGLTISINGLCGCS